MIPTSGPALVLAAALALATAGPTVPAAATTPTRVAGITLSVGDPSLVGGQLTTLRARVHLVDPDGIAPTTCAYGDMLIGGGPCLLVAVTDSAGQYWRATTQANGFRIVRLALVAGTLADGTWQGTTLVGAADAGFWRPAAITAGDLRADYGPWMDSFVPVDPSLRAGVAVNLRGSDWPIVSLALPAPTPLGTPFTIRGRVVTSRTGRPVVGAVVVLCLEERPIFSFPAWCHRVHTGAAGSFAYRGTAAATGWYASFGVDAVRNAVQSKFAQGPNVRQVVSARASSTAVPRGRSIVISGALGWNTTLPVSLQRRVGTRWRTIAVAPVSATSGAYRIRTSPPRGRWSYRVAARPTSALLAGVSRTLVVTAS